MGVKERLILVYAKDPKTGRYDDYLFSSKQGPLKEQIQAFSRKGYYIKYSTTVHRSATTGQLKGKYISEYETSKKTAGFGTKEEPKEEVVPVKVDDKVVGVSPGVAEKLREQVKEQEKQAEQTEMFKSSISKALGNNIIVMDEKKEEDKKTSLVKEFGTRVMEGVEKKEAVPSVIAGFGARITPVDPFGLRSIVTVGSGVVKGKSSSEIKSDLDRITTEATEWWGEQILTEKGEMKQPIPYFVETVPKTSTGQLAGSIVIGAGAGYVFEAVGPTVGKTALGKIITANQDVIGVAGLGAVSIVERVKIQKMIEEGKTTEDIVTDVGKDIMLMGGFSAGFQEGKVIHDIWRTRGLEEVPVEALVPPDVLSGKARFPEAGTGSMRPEARARLHLEKFETESLRLPGQEKMMGFHATDREWSKLIAGEGSSELAGTYVSYGVSPHFTRIPSGDVVKIYGTSFGFGTRPTIYGFEPVDAEIVMAKKISGIPGKPHGWEFVKEIEHGVLNIPGMKTEVEGVFKAGTEFEEVGREFFVKLGRRRIPIVTAKATGEIGGQVVDDVALQLDKIYGSIRYSSLGISPESYIFTSEGLLISQVSLLSQKASAQKSVAVAPESIPSSTRRMSSIRVLPSSTTPPSSPKSSYVPSDVYLDIPSSYDTPRSSDVSIPPSSPITPSSSGPPISPSLDIPSSPPSPPTSYFPGPAKPPIIGVGFTPILPELKELNKKVKSGFGSEFEYQPDLGSLFEGFVADVPDINKVFTGFEIRPILPRGLDI